jgi:hypothetical protein
LHRRAQLKFLRLDHREQQIREQRQGNQSYNHVFHKKLEFFAPMSVKLAGHKEGNHDSDVNCVCHTRHHAPEIDGGVIN